MGRYPRWPILILALTLWICPQAFAAAPDPGHRPGLRDQWMPQSEHDPRLQQPVHIEIIGRAAVPALKMLSDATGVSLGVAPGDLETVGERKLTIIAQGCSLKTLLVQTPNALQECHIDIDTTGPQPVYLLHRNAHAADAIAQASEDELQQYRDADRLQRLARVEAARKALAMSPEELAELAKTDPLLAAAVTDPDYRRGIEGFLSLPQDKLDEFLTTGTTRMGLTAAPADLQAAVATRVQAKLEGIKQKKGWETIPDALQRAVDFTSALLNKADTAGLGYTDEGAATGFGLAVQLTSPVQPNSASDYWIIPPQTLDEVFADEYRDVLTKTGANADAVFADLGKRHAAEMIARRDRKRQLEWREPSNPLLKRVVTLPFRGREDLARVQQFIATESGLSVVSDYFGDQDAVPIPGEATTPQPIWRLLYLLGEGRSALDDIPWADGYAWTDAGDCLVFHDRGWYRNVPREIPGDPFAASLERLKQQGKLTLDDVVALAVALDHLGQTDLGALAMAMPAELRTAGLRPRYLTSPVLLFYGALSPEQKAKACTAAGLPCRDLTAAQWALAARCAGELPQSEIPQATFRVTASAIAEHLTGPGETEAKAVPFDLYTLVLAFPSRKAELRLALRAAAPEP